jgi:hypothetical protein
LGCQGKCYAAAERITDPSFIPETDLSPAMRQKGFFINGSIRVTR